MRIRATFGLVLTGALISSLNAAPVRFEVSRSDSFIAVRTDKSGFLSFLGHKHGIVATEWSASICADPDQLTSAKIGITIPTASLRIDTSDAKQKVGLPVDGGPGADKIGELQAKMLNAANLAASEHSTIKFESASVEAKGTDSYIVSGSLDVRGTKTPVRANVKVQRKGQQHQFDGQFDVKQSAFGISPESIAGVVNVKDEVRVLFRFVAAPGPGGCSSNP